MTKIREISRLFKVFPKKKEGEIGRKEIVELVYIKSYESLISESKSLENRINIFEFFEPLHAKLALCDHIEVPFLEEVNPPGMEKEMRFCEMIPIVCKPCQTLFILQVLPG